VAIGRDGDCPRGGYRLRRPLSNARCPFSSIYQAFARLFDVNSLALGLKRRLFGTSYISWISHIRLTPAYDRNATTTTLLSQQLRPYHYAPLHALGSFFYFSKPLVIDSISIVVCVC
jgi:hypothetical protein